MCAAEEALFLPSVPLVLNQRRARIGSKLSGWMMRLKSSWSDSLEAVRPCDVHADTVSRVKARGEESVKGVGSVYSEATGTMKACDHSWTFVVLTP